MFWMLAQAADGAEEATPEDSVNNALANAGDTFTRAVSGDTEAINALLLQYALPLIWAIVILVVTLVVAKIIAGMVRRGAEKSKIDATLSAFFGKLVFYLIVIVGVMFALSKFGIEVTSFAAILAAAGFAVGMAMAGTLSNFAAGTMLLVFRPFKVGDVVNIAGVTAKVNEIELFTTTLDTFDNRRIIVPNSSVYGDTIENISFHNERRVDVNVGTEYTADLDQVREVLGKAAESLNEKMIQGEGRGYQVYLLELGDSSINWVVRFWTTGADFWAVREQLTRAVKVHLDEAGIGIPFPQMDVHLDKPE